MAIWKYINTLHSTNAQEEEVDALVTLLASEKRLVDARCMAMFKECNWWRPWVSMINQIKSSASLDGIQIHQPLLLAEDPRQQTSFNVPSMSRNPTFQPDPPDPQQANECNHQLPDPQPEQEQPQQIHQVLMSQTEPEQPQRNYQVPMYQPEQEPPQQERQIPIPQAIPTNQPDPIFQAEQQVYNECNRKQQYCQQLKGIVDARRAQILDLQAQLHQAEALLEQEENNMQEQQQEMYAHTRRIIQRLEQYSQNGT